MILPQLQKKDFRFITLGEIQQSADGGKRLTGLNQKWQNHVLTFDDPQLALSKNHGVVCGYGNLLVIDADKTETTDRVNAKLPPTLTVKGHSYYTCKDWTDPRAFIRLSHGCGEIRAGKNAFVIGAGSLHPTDGTYSVVKNLPIAEVTETQILKAFKDMITVSTDTTIPKKRDKSNSGKEFGEVCRKISAGLSKEQIFEEMLMFKKWADAGTAYRKLTYKKALETTNKPTKQKKSTVEMSHKFVLKDFAYFETLKQDKNWLVQDFLWPQTLNMLYSPPAHFKSIVALHIAICIANGKPFLGMETTRQPVLLLDKENNEQIIRARLLGLHTGHDIKHKNFPLLLLTRTGDLNNDRFVGQLKNAIIEHKIKLVVFDTLHRFADYQENVSDDINRLYTKVFAPLIDDCKCSVLFLHHTGKDGKYRGSSDLFGMIDTAYSIKRVGKTDKFDLVCEKSRFQEAEKIAGEIDFSEDSIQVLNRDASAETTATISEMKILTGKIRAQFKTESEELQRREIMDFLGAAGEEFSVSTVKRSLKWLVREKLLESNGKGKYKRLWPEQRTLSQETLVKK